jgi:HD-GYP domain-containing protein (c-di-GMP phosphodiesterase class II)
LRQILDHFDEPREGEFFLPQPGGGRLAVISSAATLGAEPPLSDHRLVTMIDITARKEAEDALREQYEIIAELSNTVLEQAIKLKNYSHTLEARVAERTAELHEANLDAIYMLAVACEAKDEDTGRHVRRIQQSAAALARELGLGDAVAEAIGYSSVLHDVGKMHVPDHILKKPGPLTDEERVAVRQHTLTGERILSDKPFFARARRIARSHHENWDGTGYPDGLAGEGIPVEARIVHLADVYDALTQPRVYKAAWSGYDAAAVIEESKGKMFEPEVVRAFRSLFARGVLGTEVSVATEPSDLSRVESQRVESPNASA